MKKNSGFTLTELLAAVVILGILMSMAVPAISGMLNDQRNKVYVEDSIRLAKKMESKMKSDNEIFIPSKDNCIVLSLKYLDDGTFEEYKVINPKIISHSEELIDVEEGEGCLSVNRYVEGIVPRYARITVEFYDENGNKVQKRVREEIAIAFQHEIDHLEGLLFTDKIDPKNPFKNQDNMRAI